jgi:hypothetical protein
MFGKKTNFVEQALYNTVVNDLKKVTLENVALSREVETCKLEIKNYESKLSAETRKLANRVNSKLASIGVVCFANDTISKKTPEMSRERALEIHASLPKEEQREFYNKYRELLKNATAATSV